MSENKENVQEQTEPAVGELLDIRYFAERMLRGLYEHNDEQMQQTLFELARLVSVHHGVNPVHIYSMIVSLWNLGTAELRNKAVADEVARRTAFLVIGEIFGKYGLNGGYYEEDEP